MALYNHPSNHHTCVLHSHMRRAQTTSQFQVLGMSVRTCARLHACDIDPSAQLAHDLAAPGPRLLLKPSDAGAPTSRLHSNDETSTWCRPCTTTKLYKGWLDIYCEQHCLQADQNQNETLLMHVWSPLEAVMMLGYRLSDKRKIRDGTTIPWRIW